MMGVRIRQGVYLTSLVSVPVLVALGLMTEEGALAWVGAMAAMAAPALAMNYAHAGRKQDEPPDEEQPREPIPD